MKKYSLASDARLLLCMFALCCPIFAAETARDVPFYDETADLTTLMQHKNESMHFKLINSKLQDKGSLWTPFDDALASFTERDYFDLKSLIIDRSVNQIQAAVNAGDLSYEELVIFYIYRIKRIESDNERFINSIIALNPDAIDRARDLDEIRASTTQIPLDSLFGIPILLKDNIGFSGLPTTAGSLALANNRTSNAFITERLLEKGAIVLGKANLSEWAYFFCGNCPSGYSALGGQTLNPYGRFQFGTGGSSSGSGASVAANYSLLAVGSETSGSILSPASANSLVGLKPTTGSLSRTGVVPVSSSLDTVGPMARSVADAVVLFNAMVGFDQRDNAMPLISGDMRLSYRDISLADKRFGALEIYADNRSYQNVLNSLQENNAVTVSVALDIERHARFTDLLGGEMVRDLKRYLETNSPDEVEIDSIKSLQDFNNSDPDLRIPYGQSLVDMMVNIDLTNEEAEQLRSELQGWGRMALDRVFAENNIDILVGVNNHQASVAALANYPALTIPMGYGEDGQPLGLTLIAPSFQEQLLIDAGIQLEKLINARRAPDKYR